MAYATPEELRLFMKLGRAFTDEETETAELYLGLAGAAIEEETGQALEQSTDTVVLDGSGRTKLILPRWPVTAVASVTLLRDDGDDEVLEHGADHDYTWSAAGILTRKGACWPCEDRSVEVEVTAGFATLPTSLKRIALRLSSSVWNNPGNLSAETLGDLSRTYNTATDIGMELSNKDRRALAAYRART